MIRKKRDSSKTYHLEYEAQVLLQTKWEDNILQNFAQSN